MSSYTWPTCTRPWAWRPSGSRFEPLLGRLEGLGGGPGLLGLALALVHLRLKAGVLLRGGDLLAIGGGGGEGLVRLVGVLRR